MDEEISRECDNGHPMVLVPKEVRRLEKDTVWSCDGPACRDVGEGTFPEKSRYRCVHYADGGKCNRDLCGDCFKPKEASTSPQEEPSLRRSGREPRPSALRAGEEWEVGESKSSSQRSDQRSPQGKLRRVGATPPSPQNYPSGRSTRRTPASADSRSEREGEKENTSREQRAREDRGGRRETRRGRDEGSPKRSMRGSSGRRRGEESSEEDQEDTPIYPAPGHVRFSPSVKRTSGTSGSPFGRKTRSGRRET